MKSALILLAGLVIGAAVGYRQGNRDVRAELQRELAAAGSRNVETIRQLQLLAATHDLSRAQADLQAPSGA